MGVRFDAHWSYRGLQALVLENDQLRAVILPELGAKLWSLTYKPVDREMLWQHPRVHPRPVPFGATYDDWFCGGWDELFPNDAPVTVGGESYPDHGEVWSMPFEWEVIDHSERAITIRLDRSGVVTATRMEKWITLCAGEPLLHFRHRFQNDGPFPLDFIWKLHPALRITPQSRIDLPAQRVLVDEGFRDRLGAEVVEFRWPNARASTGAAVDMRRIPSPESATCDFFYAVELDAGWCALTDTGEHVGFGLVFDPQVLSSVWVFGAYRGWRGLYMTILEPCTGFPYRLDEAIAGGRHSHLDPGASLETEVTAVLYRGLESVQQITRDGKVT